MNWGKSIAIAQITMSAGASVGYLLAGEYRRALYFFFGACITGSVAL